MTKSNDDLYDMISIAMASIKGRMPAIRKSINRIIRSKTTSNAKIEKLLDDLLDYIPHGLGEKEFTRLNRYYAAISPKSAEDYQRYFSEALERQ